MPAYLDPIVLTLRAGPDAHAPMNDYRDCATVTIQRDRVAYISALSSRGLSMRDALAGISAIRRMAPMFGWTEIIFDRKTDGGLFLPTHVPIVPRRDVLP